MMHGRDMQKSDSRKGKEYNEKGTRHAQRTDGQIGRDRGREVNPCVIGM
jgi:hypothetical protein